MTANIVTAHIVKSALAGIDTEAITSGILAVARGGTGTSTGLSGSGTGNVVLSNAPTLSNVTVSDTLYFGNVAANSSLVFLSANLASSAGVTVAGNVSAASYAGNGYGLSSLNMANMIGTISVVNGGTGTTTSTGSGALVLSNGPTLSNLVVKNSVFIGDTSLYDASSGVLSLRTNGTTRANIDPTGLNITGNITGDALALSNNGTVIANTTTSGQYGSWTSRTTPSSLNPWWGMCWGGPTGSKLFVAVAYTGTSNRVMTSPDGITWTERSTPSEQWMSVCWGVDKFVALASSTGSTVGKVMTSPDGITWTSRNAVIDQSWRSICWGGPTGSELFVAVGYLSNTSSGIMTSPDGITWTSRTPATHCYWYDVCWGGGLFVAVGYNDGIISKIMTSPDGITWTSRTPAANQYLVGVCWGYDKFVAVAQSGTGNRVMTSPDGITWTSRTSVADNSWNDVCWGGPAGSEKFVAVAGDGTGNRVMTSTNGISWTTETSVDRYWRAVVWGYDRFVAVSGGGYGTDAMTQAYNTVYSLGIGRTPGTGYQLDLSLDTARKLTSTTWTTGSDERIKEEIELANLEQCCDLVEAIPLKKFAWKESYAPFQKDRHQLGWIAQDVEAAGLEKAVVTSNEYGLEDFKSLNPDQLYKVMWGALQHHLRHLRGMETVVDALETP